MDEKFDARYISLTIRQDISEVTAVANVMLDSLTGVVQILGLPQRVDKKDISVSSGEARCGVESFLDPANLDAILARNPRVSLIQNSQSCNPGAELTINGRLLSESGYREGGIVVITDKNLPVFFPNPEAIQRIELHEHLQADPILKVAYTIDQKPQDPVAFTIKHNLAGLGYGNIVYELGFADKTLTLSPFVYVSNQSPVDFKDVTLTLVMPEKPKPEGNKIRTKTPPLEQALLLSEETDIPIEAMTRGSKSVRRVKLGATESEGLESGVFMLASQELAQVETIEGSVVTVDTEGKYSLSPGEHKKVGLKGTQMGYQRSNVLLINPERYEAAGSYNTSIIDAVRFTPETDLKAGSFYSDGQQLQFPTMKKGQEYVLVLRTCRNLEAVVSRQDRSVPGLRDAPVETTTYNVALVNRTGEDQLVEINIPTRPIDKMGRKFISVGTLQYTEDPIAGERYHVAKVKVGANNSVDVAFSLETK